MRIIIINPRAGTITEEDIPGQVDWKVLKERIGGDIELAGELANGDMLWVDEEGLLKGPDHAFSYAAVNPQPLLSIGIITGPEEDEEIVDAKTPLATVERHVVFLDRMQATAMNTGTAVVNGVSMITITPIIEPA